MSDLTINQLWHSRNESLWHNALKHYWEFVQPKFFELEKEMESLKESVVEQMHSEQWYEFLLTKYFPWKYTAPNRLKTTTNLFKKYGELGELDTLYQIRNELFGFDKKDIQRGLTIADKIRGLGPAGASGLLSILFPQYFGTVDQFAVKALQSVEGLSAKDKIDKINPEDITIKQAVMLIEIMREKAAELNEIFHTDYWTARKIDMILWSWRSPDMFTVSTVAVETKTFSDISDTLAECKKILLSQYGHQFRGLILYGSKARQTATWESDIDLLVLLNEPIDYFIELRRIIDILYPLQLESEQLISAKPAATNDYESGRIAFYRNVKRDGVAI